MGSKIIKKGNLLNFNEKNLRSYSSNLENIDISAYFKEELPTKYNRKHYGESAFNSVLSGYKAHAKERSLFWNLSHTEALKLFKTTCFYCGITPKQIKHRKSYGEFIYNGIDRVDNSKHYMLENCVSCCGACNKAKLDRTVLEFRDWILKVNTHLNSRL